MMQETKEEVHMEDVQAPSIPTMEVKNESVPLPPIKAENSRPNASSSDLLPTPDQPQLPPAHAVKPEPILSDASASFLSLPSSTGPTTVGSYESHARPSRAAKNHTKLRLAETFMPKKEKRKREEDILTVPAAAGEESSTASQTSPHKRRRKVKGEIVETTVAAAAAEVIDVDPPEDEVMDGEDESLPPSAPSSAHKPKRKIHRQRTKTTSSATTTGNNASEQFTLKKNTYSHCRGFLNTKNDDDDLCQICQCKRPSQLGQLACDESTCINAQLKTECDSRCPMKELCGNQRFAKQQYAAVEVRDSGAKGQGLFATQLIRKGSFIIEYVGEVLDEENCQQRIHEYRNSKHFYLLTLTSHMTIDATKKGNLGRFINHSCSPNAETQKWEVLGHNCIGLFATSDIQPNTEITFDYKYERYGGKPTKCLCSSANCSGSLGQGEGVRPKADAPGDPTSSSGGGPPSTEDEGDVDSVIAEEREKLIQIDVITAATRRLFRSAALLPPSISKTGASSSTNGTSSTSAAASKKGSSRRTTAPASGSNETKGNSSSNGIVLVAAAAAASISSSLLPLAVPPSGVSAARPCQSFPRALRVGVTTRLIQIMHLFQQTQALILPERQWTGPAMMTTKSAASATNNDDSSSHTHPTPSLIRPVLHQLLDGKLPQVRHSHYFQPIAGQTQPNKQTTTNNAQE